MSGLLIFLFLSIFGAILVAVALGVNVMETQRQRQVKSLLTALSAQPDQDFAPIILIDAKDEEGSFARNLLARLNLLDTFETHLRQSGMDWSLSTLLGAMGVGALAGFLLGYLVNVLVFPILSEVVLALLFGGLPYFWVSFKRSQ